MKLMVLNSLGSFSLVSDFKKRLEPKGHEVWKMANICSRDMWKRFEKVNPNVVFVDFCNENAIALLENIEKLPKKPRIVVRLHGYEAYSYFIWKLDWSKVDALIVVGPWMKDFLLSKPPVLRSGVDIRVIYNGIDLDKFGLHPEKDEGSMAFLGHLNKKKGIGLLGCAIASMPEREFHIAGAYQDEQVKVYLENPGYKNLNYYGEVEKTEDFLKNKQYILSTSLTESFGMSIGEGMAMGATPLVHSWPGAEMLWPKECIWTTMDELKSIEPREPEWCRKWIEDRYSLDECIDKFINVLDL